MQSHDPRLLARSSGSFALLLAAVLSLIGLRYLSVWSWPSDVLASLYVPAATVGYMTLIALVPWVVLVLPLALVPFTRRLVGPVSVAIGAALIALMQIDAEVFVADRFHLSALALRVLGASTWVFWVAYLGVAVVLCTLLLRFATQRLSSARAGRRSLALGGVAVGAFFLSQALHAWADVRYHVPITSFTPFLPLYRPMTSKHLLARWLGSVDLEEARQGSDLDGLEAAQDAVLDYPKAPLDLHPPERRLNVLLIGIDAMRADMVNERVAPRIRGFADGALRFERHFSGGNGTRPGLFSLFYGIPSTYWSAFYAAQQPPVLIQSFQAQGYRVGVFPSNPADRLVGLERTAFRSVPDLPTSVGDVAVTEGWLRWLSAQDREQPFFAFLFYESPPGGCLPGYPRVSETPLDAGGDAGLLACYETAVHFADTQVGRAIDALDAAGLGESTVVIVTSDHGQEFNENGEGFRGHGSGYSHYQLQTPMLVRWPGRAAGSVTRRTSHNDVAPTLLEEVLGCRSPSSDYSSGRNLFSDTSWDWLVAASYTSHAILEPDRVTVSYGSYYEVRDDRYHLMSDSRPHVETLARAIRETGRFLKR